MTGIDDRLKLLAVGVAVVGLCALLGAGSVAAMFTDAHDATGSVTAADKFGNGGSGGPTADAGGPYTVEEGNTLRLDGSGSSTSQGNIREYSWRIVDGPGSLSGADSVDPTYNAPANVDNDTEVTVELTVTNNKGNSDTDTTTVTVTDSTASGQPSIDSLTVTTTGNENRQLTVDADVSDPADDGDSLDRVRIEVVNTKKSQTTYTNTINVSGDSATVSDTTGQLKNKKEYRVVVTVYDTDDDSASQSRTTTTG